MILLQAAGVTPTAGADRRRTGLSGACDGTPQDSLGDWGECCAVTSCAGSLKAVAAMPFLSTAATLR